MDSLNKLMANKEELKKVLDRHIVRGVRMEGHQIGDGSIKHVSASGDELRTEREKFVKVDIIIRCQIGKNLILPALGSHPCRFSFCGQI